MVQLADNVLRMFTRNKRWSSLPIYEQYRIRNLVEYWTPKDRAEWNDFMVRMVKKKTCLTFLNDQALSNVIQAARRTIGREYEKHAEERSPELPACYYWDEAKCAQWISDMGFPEMKEAFLVNHITGNKLIALDACAINKMGVKYFDDIQAITCQIRQLLGIPTPNIMRALMRIPPMEAFLRKKLYKGRTNDLLTFRKFCEKEGFPYEHLMRNDLNARIPPTCKLILHLFPELESPEESESSSDSNSLIDVPTVECITRNALVRNRIIQSILDELIDGVFSKRRYLGKLSTAVKDSIQNMIDKGLQDLGYDVERFGKERIKFAADVSKGLLMELMRAAEVLRDIERTKKHIREDVSPEMYETMKSAAELLLDAVFPISALLCSGELELESIFRQEPTFEYFVDDIAKEAEKYSSNFIPNTGKIIDEVIMEAKLKVVAMLFPEIPIETIRSANEIMQNLLDDLIDEGLTMDDTGEKDTELKTDIPLEIDPDIEFLMGVPATATQKKPKKPPAPKFTHEEKYDPAGLPILDRLTEDELDEMLMSGKIETKDGKKITDNKLLNSVMSEKKRRKAVETAGGTSDESQKSTKSLDLTPTAAPTAAENERQSFTHEEKFDSAGLPIVTRLTPKELEEIVRTGKIELKDGARVSNPKLVEKAKEEQKRLETILATAQPNVFQQAQKLKYPGKQTPQGFQEYTREEKIGSNGKPIVGRLTEEELDAIIFSGQLQSDENEDIAEDEDLIEEAKKEKQRRIEVLDSMQDQALQQAHHSKYPGVVKPDGTFKEFTKEDKTDPKTGYPILQRLNHKELDELITTGMILKDDGPVRLSDAILAQARIEQRKRQQREALAEMQTDNYRRHYPGKVDADGHYTEYSPGEKFDRSGKPIVGRLTSNELQKLLDSKMFQGLPFTADEILDRVKRELNKRKAEEDQSKKRQQLRRKKYPGKVVDGEFQEFSREDKFDSNGFPIFENLNIEELQEIINSGEVETADGVHATSSKFLHAAQEEKQKRDALEAQVAQGQKEILKQFPRQNTGATDSFSSEEKYDSVGQPIFERLSDEDLRLILNEGQGAPNNDEQVLAIKEQERRLEEKKRAKSEEEEEIKRYRRELSAKPKSKSVGHLPAKPHLKDIVSKEGNLDKLTPEQRRLETLEAIKDLVSRKQQEDRFKAMPKTVTSTANLALLNGFIIDDYANVVGTADPFDGKIRDKSGKVLGQVTSQGMVFTQDGIALGRIGADVEQVGIGKFRALPKEAESPTPSSTDVAKSAKKESKDRGGIAPWNYAQAEIKGGILVQKEGEWVREAVPSRGKLARKTEIALQIQQAEGFSPDQVLIVEEDLRDEKLEGERKSTDGGRDGRGRSESERRSDSARRSDGEGKSRQDKGKEGKKSSEEASPEFDSERIAEEARRAEERKLGLKVKKLGPAQQIDDANERRKQGMLRGEDTHLPHTDKKKLIEVPVPVSGRWGVQTPPSDELAPHEFKPPPRLSDQKPPPPPGAGARGSVKGSEGTAAGSDGRGSAGAGRGSEGSGKKDPESQEMILKVKTGEARKLVAADGTPVGEIKKDGQIVNSKGETVGKVQDDGTIVNKDGATMTDEGMKIIRPNGVVVGRVDKKGKLSTATEKDRLLIGRIWEDGRIVTMENVLVGIVTKDGRILGPGGKAIGLFTPGWELLGTDGVPFAYVTSDGKVYRYEVIPQRRYEVKPKEEEVQFTGPEPKKSETVIIFHKKRSLDTAFEFPPTKPVPSRDFTVAEKKYSFEAVQPEEKYKEEIAMPANKSAERERLKREEEMRKMYDLDDTHKKAAPKKLSPTDSEIGTQTSQSGLQDKKALGIHDSQTDHRVAKTSQEYLKQKQLHRKQLIENWANEVSSLMDTQPDYFQIDPTLNAEERSKIAKTAADNILDDIFKLGLTHLLLQAEAGDDTERILKALAAIQTTGEGQALWATRKTMMKLDKDSKTTLLKNMISLLPTTGEDQTSSDDDGKQDGPENEPSTAEAGVNTEKAKEHHHHHHHHHHHRRSGVIEVKEDKEKDILDKWNRQEAKEWLKESRPKLSTHGRFNMIINADEIEQVNQVFDNTGKLAGLPGLLPRRENLPQKGRSQPLHRIPHPGVIDKAGKMISMREDVAEQIHHGKQILANIEPPIRPPNLPMHRRV